MSPWRSNGKRQKCRFGAERVKQEKREKGGGGVNFICEFYS